MKRSFFSVELCFPFASANALHGVLRNLLERAPSATTAEEKWRLHREAARDLEEYMGEAVRGCWEYMDDDEESNMWNDWMRPLQDASRRPRGDSAGGFFTFTIMMQPQRFTKTDRVVANAFGAVEGETWKRGTFAAMLRVIPGISFASVIRDAMYMMPRDSNCGWTDDELRQEHMQYLRTLS